MHSRKIDAMKEKRFMGKQTLWQMYFGIKNKVYKH